jgi:hypothetical protein
MFEPAVHARIEHIADADRCEFITPNGPCPYKKVEGASRCELHAANNDERDLAHKARRIYLAAQWQAQIGTFATPDEIKNLRQEIGILKLTLMKMMSACQTDQDLLMRSSSISELVVKIGKVVETAHKMDVITGRMLDKEQLASFGQRVIELVSNFVKDPDLLSQFAKALVDEIKRTGTEELAARQ